MLSLPKHLYRASNQNCHNEAVEMLRQAQHDDSAFRSIMMRPMLLLFLTALPFIPQAQILASKLATNNITWTTPSHNVGESMSCGGDISLNVWAENGDVLFYIARSGTFDENNSLLKLGRVRLHLTPNPFGKGTFKQQLALQTGDVTVHQQGLAGIKDRLYNPLTQLIFGGMLQGPNMQPAGTATGRYLNTPYTAWKLKSRAPARSHSLTVALHTATVPTAQQWQHELQQTLAATRQNPKAARQRTLA